MFVVRTAGHVIDAGTFESIKYANSAIEPHIEKVIVLGHESCGAVKAAFKSLTDDSVQSAYPAIVDWLQGVCLEVMSNYPELDVRLELYLFISFISYFTSFVLCTLIIYFYRQMTRRKSKSCFLNARIAILDGLLSGLRLN